MCWAASGAAVVTCHRRAVSLQNLRAVSPTMRWAASESHYSFLLSCRDAMQRPNPFRGVDISAGMTLRKVGGQGKQAQTKMAGTINQSRGEPSRIRLPKYCVLCLVLPSRFGSRPELPARPAYINQDSACSTLKEGCADYQTELCPPPVPIR